VALLARPDIAVAQDASPGATVDTVTPGAHYAAGVLHRFFFGRHYRDLWTTPIAVPVLDPYTYAGGLRVVSRGGGMQTRGLRFVTAEGRQFSFRSLDKNLTAVLPEELRPTIAGRIVQDQASSAHPAGALIVGPILEAAGVRQPRADLIVLPDDPALGQWRPEFAGLLGTFEERPLEEAPGRPGYAGAVRIVNSDTLLAILRRQPRTAVDARAFLTARLVDLYVGDWDRHRGQWRWLQTAEDPASPWLPVAEDRDQALVKLDGFLLYLARFSFPQLISFAPDYARITGATWNGRDLDRRLLAGLERPVWDSAAAWVASRITDSVIAAAVNRLPAEWAPLNGEELRRNLLRRRDELGAAATRFYEYLAGEVNLHGTDSADMFVVERQEGGLVTVRKGLGGLPAERVRRFDPRETRELRLYLHGGDDRVLVAGAGEGRILLRVVGGAGDDAVVDSSRAGGVRVYDFEGRTTVEGHGARLDERPYESPIARRPPNAVEPRDWGYWMKPTLWMSGGPDVGLFVGGGWVATRYAFRHHPYAWRMRLRAGYATTAQTGRVDYSAEWRRLNSGTRVRLHARASGVEILRFYGFGNQTQPAGDQAFHRVSQEQYRLEPELVLRLDSALDFAVGPFARYAETDLRRFIGTLRPYGTPSFGEVGMRAALRLDTRDVPAAARRGVYLNVEGSVVPEVWDVLTTFGAVEGEAATYLSTRGADPATLALRAGGRSVFGDYPFHEAAFVGGASTVRGLFSQRFAGDAAVWGNAELRLPLSSFYILLPGRMGVFLLADAGRVFLDGERSSRWHTGLGGGLWFAFLERANTITITLADGEDRLGLYVRAGFAY
jgi:hypothetical protein